MRPASFSYLRPESVEEAVGLLWAAGGDALVLAGGQSLLPLLAKRSVRPSALVDIGGLTGLRYLRSDGDGLRIGALTRHVDVERANLGPAFGVLPEAARLIGHLPIRTRGTVGGSLAHATPCAEWCLLAVLLDALVVVRGPGGERAVPAAEFLVGPHRTAAASDELVVEVRLPVPAPTAALVEHSIQRGEPAMVAAAAAVETDGVGRVVAARLALDGVADRPLRIGGAELALLGEIPDPALVARVAEEAVAVLKSQPPEEPRYRTEVAEALVIRAVHASLAKNAVTQGKADER